MAAGACPSTLLIVAGQSNALGFGVTPSELPPELAAPDAGVRIWDGAGFATLQPGVNAGNTGYPEAWGPEVAFARRWRRDHPQGALHVIKVARGSVSLAPDPSDATDWSPGSGRLFAETTAAAQAARRVLPAPVETIILWHQGEADAVYPAKAQAYADNLAAFRRRAVEAWAGGQAVFVVARIHRMRWGDSPVRAAQDLHGAYSTDDFPLQADELHLTGEGQIASGVAAYETYRRLAQNVGGAQIGS